MTFRPPLYMQNSDLFSYSAADDRFLVDTLFSEGILNVQSGQGLAVQRPEGANMTVSVAPFDAIVKGDDAALQGSYLLRMTAGESATVTAAPATNSRIDLLVVEVIDSAYRTVNTAAPEGPRLRVIAGTAAATPTVPTLPATAIPLAQITVAAGQASIQTANITDLRTAVGGGSGAIGAAAQPLTATQIAALATAAKYQGRLIENITTGKLQHVTAAGATPVDVATAVTKAQGTYTGSDTQGTKPPRAIPVGFAPDLVLISSNGANSSPFFSWLHRTEQTYSQTGLFQGSSTAAAFTDFLTSTGFTVGQMNVSPAVFAWTAWKFS